MAKKREAANNLAMSESIFETRRYKEGGNFSERFMEKTAF